MKIIRLNFVFLLFFISDFVNGQCYLSGFNSLGQLSKSTGNFWIDQKMNVSQIDLQIIFGVTADLYIYDDGESPNAYATPSCDKSYCDGKVAFGYNLMNECYLRSDYGEAAIVGILAHEFAHILQFKMNSRLTGKARELQADFLAGYFFARSPLVNKINIQNFANKLFSIGDFMVWSEHHHGTPAERVQAMSLGFNCFRMPIGQAYGYSLGLF